MLVARAVIGSSIVTGHVSDEMFKALSGTENMGSAANAYQLDEIRLLTPCEPNRVFAVLGGFRSSEALADPPPPKVLCPKIASQVIGLHDAIVRPPFINEVLMEAEMAAVIGTTLKSATTDEARDGIWGYTCCNDVTAPELYPEYYLSKSLDTFTCLGPWIRTDLTDEEIMAGLHIVGRVNGQVVQRGTTRLYKFKPSEWISHLSKFMTLQRGDVVTLGTPPPGIPIRDGDTVEVEVEGIGVLTNQLIAGS